MPRPPPPPHPSRNEDQGVLGARGPPTWAAQGLAPSDPSTVPPSHQDVIASAPAAQGSSLWPPTLLIGATQVPAAEFFLSASPTPANVRQQVGRSQMVFFFSSPTERTRLVRFCAVGHRPRRVWAGRGRAGLGSLVARVLPPRTRVRGARPRRLLPPPRAGRRPPCPRRVRLGRARGTLWLGLRRLGLTRSAPAGGR